MNAIEVNIGTVKRFLSIMNLETFEVRDIKIGYSGYYNNVNIAATEIEKHFKENRNSLYITMNPIKVKGLEDKINKPLMRAENTTKDSDIKERKHILIDFDPERPKGTNATTEAKKEAFSTARRIGELIRDNAELGLYAWPKLASNSGNGVHLFYEVEGEGDTESVKALLYRLKAIVEQGQGCIKVDTSVCNLARIVRIAGVPNTKTDIHLETKLFNLTDTSVPIKGARLKELEALAKEEKENTKEKAKDKPKKKTKEPVEERNGMKIITHKANDKQAYAELKKIESALECLDSSIGHGEWVKCLYALREAGERIGVEKALELAHEWSGKSALYDTKAGYEIDKLFAEGVREITIGTLYHMAQEKGWVYDKYGYLFEGVTIAEKKELPTIPKECFPTEILELSQRINGSTGIEEKAILAGSLSVLSAALCDKAKIKIGEWEECLVWSTCLVADTGARKTMLLHSLLAPLASDIERNLEAYGRQFKAWERERQRVERDIVKLAKEEGNETRIQFLEDTLEAKRPVFPDYRLNSSTPEAMIDLLEKTRDKLGKSKAFLWTDEGEEVLNAFTGHYNSGKTNNKIFLAGHDGKGHTEARKTSGYRSLKSVLIPMLFAVQPVVIKQALSTHGSGLRGQGMLARLNFIPFERSPTGYASLRANSVYCGEYEKLIRDMLEVRIEDERERYNVLTLSLEGEEYFTEIFDALEREEFIQDEIQDYRCKWGGKVLRLAGILHYAFRCIGNEIGKETLEKAYKLYCFYRDTALCFVTNEDVSIEKYIKDVKEFSKEGKEWVTARDFRNYRKEKPEEILSRLEDAGYVRQIGDKPRYALNPILRDNAVSIDKAA